MLLLLANCLFFTDCQKTDISNSVNSSFNQPAMMAVYGGSQNFLVNETGNEDDAMTVLGGKRVNPFTVEVMNQAYINLYKMKGNLPVTHLYIKISPQQNDDLKKLDELGINFYDYPLEYEVLQMGEYYQDPSIPSDQPTFLYAVIKPDVYIPVANEVVAKLHLPQDENLILEAFRITGNDKGDISYAIKDNNPPITSVGYDGGSTSSTPSEPSSCGINSGPCNCSAPSEQRRPSGCISVVDDALNTNEGVRRVKVILKDSWFTENETFTSDRGCYEINSKYRGKACMWVKFKSSRTTVRGLRGARVWEYALAVKDYVGTLYGPDFRNNNVVYSHVTADDNRGKLYWYAATANNALHEFDEMSNCFGLTTTHNDLDILLTNYAGAAATPMLDKIFDGNPLIAAWAVGFVAGPICNLFNYIPIFGAPLYIVCASLSVMAAVFAPDIVYNYGDEGTGFRSDRVKNTFYHEYAHAAHYRGIRSESRDEYWMNNIIFIVGASEGAQNPYGSNRNRPGADRCAVVEAWGNHIGDTFSDVKYGINHSLAGAGSSSAFRESRRHIFQLEQFNPNDLTNGSRWLPEGLGHDLIDNNALNPSGVTDPIADNMQGFTTSQYFQSMINGIPSESPNTLRFRLTNMTPSGQNPAEVGNIFTRYGW